MILFLARALGSSTSSTSGLKAVAPYGRWIKEKAASHLKVLTITALTVLLTTEVGYAGEEGGVDKADTLWILVASAMVLLMTPGLALFYAGMARRKNVLATMMQSYFILCLIIVQWIVIGYSLSFGDDIMGIVGSLNYVMLSGVGMEANGSIPHLLFMVFQGMFAAITVALITGGFAERMKFSAVVLFALLWATFIYDPLCHWVWGGGWLGELGTLDFAGGLVVHISCGVSALIGALVLGERNGWLKEPMPPHNLGMTMTGMGLLWFGWFGFNAGSALAIDDIAINAFITTNTAAAVATLTWTFIEWKHRGKPTVLGALSGTVAGLGTITPASGFVTPGASIIIGFLGGAICYWMVSVMKTKLRYDDSLDVFGIHGVGGIIGSLAIGLFGSIGTTGLFYGGGDQLLKQVIGVSATILFSAVGTYVLLKIVDAIVGLRVGEEEEQEGLDLAEHGESGYNL